MVIPVEIDTVLKVLNLPNDARITSTFTEHAGRVMIDLERYSEDLAWEDLNSDEVETNQENSYKYAYCYLLLANTIQFLNLKTIGEGIIKTTGFDANSTELLSGNEISNWKKSLEIEALTMIKSYLSDVGLDRYRELNTGAKEQRTKACMI